jgi:hypothetical protein
MEINWNDSGLWGMDPRHRKTIVWLIKKSTYKAIQRERQLANCKMFVALLFGLMLVLLACGTM